MKNERFSIFDFCPHKMDILRDNVCCDFPIFYILGSLQHAASLFFVALRGFETSTLIAAT